jgi:hypothetical protein
MAASSNHRKLLTLFFLFSFPAGLPGQTPYNTPSAGNPPDLHFVLSAKEGRTQYRLGEAIELDQAYSSSSPGKYLWLDSPSRINGGRGPSVAIHPENNVIDRFRDTGEKSAIAVLHANCTGWGFGSVFGGGCGDCHGTLPLKAEPIHFPFSVALQFQILEPGHYSIQASSANVTLAPLDVESSKPIPLVSNTLEIDVVNDPIWASSQLHDAVEKFEAKRSEYTARGWDTKSWEADSPKEFGERTQVEFEAAKAATIIKGLDTEESLAEMVRLYTGSEHLIGQYANIFYQGIIQSKHPALAIRLMSERILEPDFQVSKNLLDQLTAMELRLQSPEAFDRDERALYPAARKILHDHVLALGKSLEKKNPDALKSSLQAFTSYASEDFCTGQALIPPNEEKQLLRHAGTQETASQQ